MGGILANLTAPKQEPPTPPPEGEESLTESQERINGMGASGQLRLSAAARATFDKKLRE